MSEAGWVACAADEAREDVLAAAAELGVSPRVAFAESADALRGAADAGRPRGGVIVGRQPGGVSAVNLAAALVSDGGFSQVVLVEREASGSLRSRAARAGVDLVIDPAELPRAPSGVEPSGGAFGPDGPSVPEPVLDASPSPRGAFPAPAQVRSRGPIVVFASGRGGVGKTALAACAASTASSWGMSVAAVDLDLSCGNLYSCFGMPGGLDLALALESRGSLAGAMAGAPAARCGARLAGPCGRPEQAELVMPRVCELLEAASRAFDLVVVDTSTTFTDAVAQAAQMADRLLMVGRGSSGASSLARASGLAVRLGVARTRIAKVENFSAAKRRRRADPTAAAVGLEGARTFFVEDGGEEARELIGAGRVEELHELGVPLADSVGAMLAQVLAELGCLPDCEEACRAAQQERQAAAWPWLAKRKEARSA